MGKPGHWIGHVTLSTRMEMNEMHTPLLEYVRQSGRKMVGWDTVASLGQQEEGRTEGSKAHSQDAAGQCHHPGGGRVRLCSPRDPGSGGHSFLPQGPSLPWPSLPWLPPIGKVLWGRPGKDPSVQNSLSLRAGESQPGLAAKAFGDSTAALEPGFPLRMLARGS